MKASKWYMARVQVAQAMEQGLPWHEAAKRAGLPISQSTAYRLRQRMQVSLLTFVCTGLWLSGLSSKEVSLLA